MKKAFTLIELLVVIAIIAILAAILFPVFAQAKLAAKKTVSISNAKQQGLGLLLYTGDNEDIYPRNDACEPGSSLNPKFKAASYNASPMQGCFGPYYNRVNNFSWQKWIMPYLKSVDITMTPLREKTQTAWDNDGQLFNQFLLNNGLTGSLYISNLGTGQVGSRGKRNPWLGGSTTAIPRPSSAMILMEASYNIGVIPAATDDTQWNQTSQDIVAYPIAFREYWKNKFNKTPRGVLDCFQNTVSNEVDTRKAVTGGITVAFSDGSAKFMKTGDFLAKSPSKADLIPGSSGAYGGYTYQNDCHGMPGGSADGNLGIRTPRTDLDYPLWGFGN
ncbi:prepilin-type N-terminal cleavage/methylation domain-containing protein [bacterium]|nr:MAG: prepilin-type N-terminal cleavage/methylation domain-containing protein [bacterium]